LAALTAHGRCGVPVTSAAAGSSELSLDVRVGQPLAVPTSSTADTPSARTSACRSSTGSTLGVTQRPHASANCSLHPVTSHAPLAIGFKELILAGTSLDHAADKDWPCVRIFYGFSGPAGRADGFEAWARRAGNAVKLNVSVFMADATNGVDLADELTWERLLRELAASGGYDASLWSPPCSTFSAARNLPGGPPPLRGPRPPELYGLHHLTYKQKEQVRLGTLLACRAAQGIRAHRGCDRPYILENPAEPEDGPSLFNLPEIVDACGEDVIKSRFPQCGLGAESVKLTDWRSNFLLPSGPSSSCEHPKRWWRLPPNGSWLWTSHPPLKGRHRAVLPEVWDDMHVDNKREPETEFLTRSAAAYSSDLNAYLAAALVSRISARLSHRPLVPSTVTAPSFTRTGRFANVLIAKHLLWDINNETDASRRTLRRCRSSSAADCRGAAERAARHHIPVGRERARDCR